MSGIVCGFSGRVGSGKTSVSEEVARHLNWPRVSFGAYVRRTAEKQGLDSSSRSVLQTVGETLFNNGIEEFCWSTINQVIWKPGQSLIIDGIRHQDILNKLKEIVAPSYFVLVYIDVNEDHRLRRIAQRDGLNRNDLMKIDEHSTEKDTKILLRQLADIAVNSERTPDLIVSEIVGYLEARLGFV